MSRLMLSAVLCAALVLLASETARAAPWGITAATIGDGSGDDELNRRHGGGPPSGGEGRTSSTAVTHRRRDRRPPGTTSACPGGCEV